MSSLSAGGESFSSGSTREDGVKQQGQRQPQNQSYEPSVPTEVKNSKQQASTLPVKKRRNHPGTPGKSLQSILSS